ncbi:di-heme-cytochrome C peroxidase [Teredinibacter turnerae]|uniref:di-heme-cytochrome C peroxidase n=1 Tax=Teredinibacter turnerae TaxID=2426 RepID=UPI00035ED4F2|nr:di-heme-cytochrome C peroxidase [Teredinibacter turnerae]
MKKGFLRVLTLAATCTLLNGCTYLTQGVWAPETRGAQAAGEDLFGDHANRIVYLEQNWGPADSLWFYNTTQGSDLLPYDIFLYLEQADSRSLFRSDENMRHYRYLVQNPTKDNPDGLPVGMVKDTYLGREYMGFTCAACHTSQLNYQGLGIRIDGAPPLADMDGFMHGLEAALLASLEDDEKFTRLAKNVLGKHYPEGSDELRALLDETHQRRKAYNYINAPLHGPQLVAYGYGRLDAFGRIYNRVLHQLTPDDFNFNPANAPVSYPFLWDTPQHDYVQWNGVGANAKTGALGRNVGEVMGVFGSMDLSRETRSKGYVSSVDVRNIVRLEHHLAKLYSPVWPADILPPVDETLAARGKEVFVEYRCHQCHQAIIRDDPKRQVFAQMASLDLIGTDSTAVDNAIAYQGKTGYFYERATPKKFVDAIGSRYPEKTSVLPMLVTAGEGIVKQPDPDKSYIRRLFERLYDVITAVRENPAPDDLRQLDFLASDAFPTYLRAYKGRPLNGIWATAPYLHNGSVPNLYELFLPQCDSEALLAGEVTPGETCRSVEFTVGSREFDPDKVGYVQRSAAEYPGLFVFNTRLPSNSNAGHEYAAGKTPVLRLDAANRPILDENGKPQLEWLPPISKPDRWALVEYLKTL